MTLGPVAAPGIVLLGPPASGKGTQGRMLAEHCELAYLSTGKQLRRELKAGSALGQRAEPFLAAGQFVPDDLALTLALDWIKGVEGGWVLDGFPRTLPQAENLDAFLGPQSDDLRALLLEVPASELERRVADRRECSVCPWTGTRAQAEASGHCPSCGGDLVQRQDDHLVNFRMRLKAFDDLTSPVAHYYDSTSRLQRVMGTGPPEEVFRQIQALYELP